MQNEATQNNTFLKVGGVAAILSGIITQVSGALHPVETATIFDPATHMKEIAANPTWNAVYLGFTVGFLLMLVGLNAISRAIVDEPAASWARVARSVATATTAVALVFFVVDGFAAKTVALAMTANPTDATIAAAGAVDRVGRAFFGHWTLLSWGVTPLLFGVTVLQSTTFKKWLGAFPIISGLAGLTVGLIQDFGDFSLGLLPPFYAAVLVFNVWMVTMGVTLLRRSPSSATRAVQVLGTT